jgi:hypothetical protein
MMPLILQRNRFDDAVDENRLSEVVFQVFAGLCRFVYIQLEFPGMLRCLLHQLKCSLLSEIQ